MVQLLTIETTSWGGKLHWPQEVGGSLEVWTNSEDFVDNVLNALNTVLSQTSLDNSVGAEWDSLAVGLTETALVDKVADRLQTWVTIGDEWLNQSEHLGGGSVDANEDTIVDLAQAKKLQDLLHLRRNTDDTTNSDDEDQLLFWRNVQLTVSLGGSSVIDGFLSELLKETKHYKNVSVDNKKKLKQELSARSNKHVLLKYMWQHARGFCKRNSTKNSFLDIDITVHDFPNRISTKMLGAIESLHRRQQKNVHPTSVDYTLNHASHHVAKCLSPTLQASFFSGLTHLFVLLLVLLGSLSEGLGQGSFLSSSLGSSLLLSLGDSRISGDLLLL